MIKTDYLQKVFDVSKFQAIVVKAVKSIIVWSHTTSYDAIAFTGVSGAALAFPLSIRLNKPLLCVRKKDSSRHSSFIVEGNFSAKNYIIVDDFVVSGDTLTKIKNDISKHVGLNVKCVGVYLYDSQPYAMPESLIDSIIPHR